ncbi:MAG: hypothetical protein HYV27_15240 [Candidatus Hydrogenedentes bacterium]|nr:hypothetical protein [Candidatus Hydrogenedentota bacterium]
MTPNTHYQVMFSIRAKHPKTGRWYAVGTKNYHDPADAQRIAERIVAPACSVWWHCPKTVSSQSNPQARYYSTARKFSTYAPMPTPPLAGGQGGLPPEIVKGRPTGRSTGRPSKHGERGQTYSIYIPPSIAQKLIHATPENEISAGVIAAAALLPD